MTSGVYLITCKHNGRRYVGSSSVIEARYLEHFSKALRGQHHSHIFQQDFDVFGMDGFGYSVLEEVETRSELKVREQYYLDILQPEYNISPYANRPTNKGKKASAETLRRMSESNQRVWAALTEAERAARGQAVTHPHSEETKRVLSERTRQAYEEGKLKKRYGPRPESTKAKIKVARARQAERQKAQTAKKREAWEAGRAGREQERRRKLSEKLTGRRLSAATKAKLRGAATEQMSDPEMQARHQAAVRAAMQRPEVKAAMQRRSRPKYTAEHREKIAAAHRGKKRPPETGQKIAAAKRGKKHSPETIEKLKAAQQARWARVRAAKEKGDT